jgi:CRP/FNR family transcriptional regulator, cyclic AMP receptor protein
MASPEPVRTLLATYLFQDLSPVQLEPLVAASRVREYKGGEYVLRAGDRADELYVVISGTIKESMPTADGYEYVAELLVPGGVFGEPGIFATERTRIVDELVIVPATVLIMDRGILWDFLQTHPPVMLRLLEGFANQARESIEIMAGVALRRVRERVIFRLLERADTHGTPVSTGKRIEVSMSQSNLAGMVGASRENVNRAISALAAEGHVKYRAGVFTINADALRRIAPAVAPELPRRNQRLPDIGRR